MGSSDEASVKLFCCDSDAIIGDKLDRDGIIRMGLSPSPRSSSDTKKSVDDRPSASPRFTFEIS
jgi:hypothetical protein